MKQQDQQQGDNTYRAKKKKLLLPKNTRVKIPPRIKPGMTFMAMIQGKEYSIICPKRIPLHRRIRVSNNLVNNTNLSPSLSTFDRENDETIQLENNNLLVVDTVVPERIKPFDFFEIQVYGTTIQVQCPKDGNPGQYFQCQINAKDIIHDTKAMKYNNNNLVRTVCAKDLKFRWMNNSKTDDAIVDQSLEEDDIVFVRHLTFQEGKDKRLPTGILSLVSATEATFNSTIEDDETTKEKKASGDDEKSTVVTFNTISDVQVKPLEEKLRWFHAVCKDLGGGGNCQKDGNNLIKLVIRREHLMQDSIKAVMSMGKEHLRMPWCIEFIHEPGVDWGGVTREWFQLVSQQLFNPKNNGLWVCSPNNPMNLAINPSSASACDVDYLLYFRFAGRLLGRALFDQQIVKGGHLASYLYKHFLGLPITMQDLADYDYDFYVALRKLRDIDDFSELFLDFTVTEQQDDSKPTSVEIITGGCNKSVTKHNLKEYYRALLQYRVLERTKLQTTELVLGFLDVIPEAPLAIFDSNELESTLCGLPIIDVEDWKANTVYSGAFSTGKEEPVQWFWEIVTVDFDNEQRSRLLQFVTGSSGVSLSGFASLGGFVLEGDTTASTDRFPKARTCFNRLIMPCYKTKDELLSKFKTAISLSLV
eukprot:CAMPEP_0194162162 /NCGR_PEP_ID=MMETSP0152-20130528/79347_1 /TAXON_ID=1049557 /ORGANISM="Thalassiothrix antarctica, Strain L6-D1" /LENGTH=644 /DNA_ID=CAMNT_0038872039 /DNA_START=179 /DNA_END=2110 /DNA_ORIENTATION=-